MSVFYPNAKINIGLRIIEKRNDGFHNLETLFVPYPLYDILEIIKSPDNNTHMFNYGKSYSLPSKNHEKELCIQAFRLLEKDYTLTPVHIGLYKNIPIGAGLGGGSADAAFTLKALNQIFNLRLSCEKLCEYAAILGSDVPFFIYNEPMFARGKGDIFSSIDNISNKHPFILQTLSPDSLYEIRLITPKIHISTKEAYDIIDLHRNNLEYSEKLEKLLENSITDWKNLIKNDFENIIFSNHPELAKIKKDFYDNGALYASMSGSGSSVYGIFKK
ncbi:MAG: 4-(cytidine 5'-diphospho)-2-C-methyl-D-erythritol kinase [Bacteroidales bacterium]